MNRVLVEHNYLHSKLQIFTASNTLTKELMDHHAENISRISFHGKDDGVIAWKTK